MRTVERRVVAIQVHVRINFVDVPARVAERKLRLLHPEQVFVDDGQAGIRGRTLARLQRFRIDRGDLVALIVQAGDFASDPVLAEIRQLSVELVAPGLGGKEGLRVEVTFWMNPAVSLPMPDWPVTDPSARPAAALDCIPPERTPKRPIRPFRP
jgi:hypothetical protein